MARAWGPSRDNGTGKGRSQVEVVVPPELAKVADEVEKALALLVDAELVTVRRHSFWIEVEIRADILFPSGVAIISPSAVPALQALATTLAPYPNPVRVEGHTDNVPIKTVTFPSNWELSSARAASVVHLLSKGGVAPERLSVIGLGEWHPMQPNDTVEGRNANRRVLLVILSGAADSPDNYAKPLPDIHREDADAQQAVPGEAAAPISPSPAPASPPLPTAAATGAPSTTLPPAVTPGTR